MAMKVKYNLDSLVSKAVHGHCYLRADGIEAGNAKYVSDVEREKGIYSSPRNIRKLFIKSTGVDIVYYRPVVGRGDVLSESVKFAMDERKMLTSTYDYYESKINRTYVYPDDVAVSGTGFAAFRNELSISNLEELYFDWTMLLGNESLFSLFYNTNQQLNGYAISGLNLREYEFYNSINEITTTRTKRLQAEPMDAVRENSLISLLMSYITREMCGNRPGGLAANYPRLKYVGFIGNSNRILKSDGGITKQNIFNYEFNAIYNSASNIKVLQEDLCAGDRFRFCLFADTGVDLLEPTFRVDGGIYLFDEQYLYPYLKSAEYNREFTREEELNRHFFGSAETTLGLESKLGWLKKFRAGELQRQKFTKKKMSEVQKAVEEATPKVDAVPRTEIEKTLAKIYRIEGEKSVAITLKCLEMQYGKENLVNEINKFSEAGREFYMTVYRSVEE